MTQGDAVIAKLQSALGCAGKCNCCDGLQAQINDLRNQNNNDIMNGGWHFSYLLTPKEIQRKIKTFAHTEYNKKIYTDINTIKSKIKNKIDLFGRKTFFDKVELDKNFPEYIYKNRKKLKNWII
jgi:beta-1,4-mannosyl-glycoprotein beta-1,4-N-acetylglucosaminyltransferase